MGQVRLIRDIIRQEKHREQLELVTSSGLLQMSNIVTVTVTSAIETMLGDLAQLFPMLPCLIFLLKKKVLEFSS